MDIDILLHGVIELCYETGNFISHEREHFNKSAIEYKSFNSLVSYVDKEAEKKIVSCLKKLLPESNFITEEETEKPSQGKFTWIIDPLDGTTNFIHNIPCYCISIGLKKDDEIILGVIYEMNLEECFYAVKGKSAYCNGKEIHVSNVVRLDDSLIATGFPYENFGELQEYLRILSVFMKKTHGVRRLGSAAIDLAYTACGRFEGFFEYNLNSWDVAAGSLIVKQAGGIVTDFSGGDNYIFGKQIVAACGIHAEMLKIIGKK
ncbi:MAG: inositol monophosphatase [Bacteroidetes bacterium RIFCSPLOWO2_12_FULL_37_12]|nr:MAG: inositol monophosphatase [Bacteroidetes bacterium RIFCSPLOWO2_12_FULL_37_12]